MDNQLTKIQEIMMQILDEIDTFCKDNEIKYSLYAGTALGAARHKGFIPWDDDMDIIMLRDDYEKFLRLWKDCEHPGFIIQNKDIAPKFKESFTKIRKDHTTFIQNEWEKGAYHTGVFVDIMPFDRIPNNSIQRLLFKSRAIKYLLLIKDFSPLGSSIFEKIIYKFISLFFPKNCRKNSIKKTLRKLTQYNSNKNLPLICFNGLWGLKRIHPADIMNSFMEVEYDGHSYMCVSQLDLYLKIQYGDYMKLPPVEERTWFHKPILLDFTKNYEELQ